MEERLNVLERVEAGEISAAQGARLLEALVAGDGRPPSSPGSQHPEVPRPALINLLWQAIFWPGVAAVVGGGLLVALVYAWDIPAPWLVLGWVFFVLGVLAMALGWWLRGARWLALRVRQDDGPNIAFALPLPLGLAAWGLRIARPFVPHLRETAVDELILAMRDELRDGRPLIVEVNEGEGGEQVQVYLA